ncbi:MAG TPA: hypothetical protein PK011_02710 [Marinagarivorans sp.]|nr:hypothetical protein [Cellvibrionaceae bacterium]HMY38212.1 hypothetical protein [Marinagarivorans sp.]HNG59959.1 hypothetical protein [Cellvibrionaceae bacterium]
MSGTVLKLELDLSEMFHQSEEGGEYSIKEIFMDAVKSEVARSLREFVRSDIARTFSDFVSDELKSEIRAEMRIKLRNFMDTQELSEGYGKVTVSAYLERMFNELIQGSTIRNQVADIAKSWGAELKKQYDIAYANKLVQTLNDQGLLLPNVGQLLLDKSS